jgi:hypothetical protein
VLSRSSRAISPRLRLPKVSRCALFEVSLRADMDISRLTGFTTNWSDLAEKRFIARFQRQPPQRLIGEGRRQKPAPFSPTSHFAKIPWRPHHMPALISVCSVAAFAASFCSSAAAMEAFKALVSFIC